MSIDYATDRTVTVEQFVDLLERSTLAERRPVHDRECMAGALAYSDLVVTAWEDGQLVGIARSVTDFHTCCYLADLAVDARHQRSGIGRQLQRLTRERLGPHCTLVLLAAPAAAAYYPRIGYAKHDGCWILERDAQIS